MKIFRFILSLALAVASIGAVAQSEVRFFNEQADTARISELLSQGASHKFADNEARVAFFARNFIGTPYVAHTLENDTEILTVNIDQLDCTTFVETALALAYTSAENRKSWRDYIYNLRRFRYRNGTVDGYPSRLHYICDWAIDNMHRGNISDATRFFPRINYMVRTIDFMSNHRKSYPALADSANFARIKAIEDGYRNHRFPYIRTSDLGAKDTKTAFRNGDVVAFVSALKDLDVTHMGIIVKESPSADPYVLHASQTGGKVEITKQTLAEFVKKNRQWIGVRVFRLADQ